MHAYTHTQTHAYRIFPIRFCLIILNSIRLVNTHWMMGWIKEMKGTKSENYSQAKVPQKKKTWQKRQKKKERKKWSRRKKRVALYIEHMEQCMKILLVIIVDMNSICHQECGIVHCSIWTGRDFYTFHHHYTCFNTHTYRVVVGCL